MKIGEQMKVLLHAIDSDKLAHSGDPEVLLLA
jgi:hypothetical protein